MSWSWVQSLLTKHARISFRFRSYLAISFCINFDSLFSRGHVVAADVQEFLEFHLLPPLSRLGIKVTLSLALCGACKQILLTAVESSPCLMLHM